jgi:hypothetical protein
MNLSSKLASFAVTNTSPAAVYDFEEGNDLQIYLGQCE